MKRPLLRITPVLIIAALLAASPAPRASAADPDKAAANDSENPFADNTREFNATYQFIFFATLEGLYRDGVSQADVDSLLACKKGGGYLNFIYTCPICMPVEAAILTYKQRPSITHLKTDGPEGGPDTFGPGLPKEISAALASPKPAIRLKAVNALVSKWIQYRMDHSGLIAGQKKNLVDSLKKGRDEGMRALRDFAKNSNGPHSMDAFAAGYEDGAGDECAICNAALQMPLKLKTPAP